MYFRRKPGGSLGLIGDYAGDSEIEGSEPCCEVARTVTGRNIENRSIVRLAGLGHVFCKPDGVAPRDLDFAKAGGPSGFRRLRADGESWKPKESRQRSVLRESAGAVGTGECDELVRLSGDGEAGERRDLDERRQHD